MFAQRKKWSFPHCYALIFGIIVVVAALTWIVPSGNFDRHDVTLSDGSVRAMVVPGTFHSVPKVADGKDLRQGVFAILSAPADGLTQAVDVVGFVLIVGGAFGIITRTGAIDRGLRVLSTRLAGKGIFIIPIAMTLFSLGGSTFGMSEETIPLYAIFISLMFSLGYDSMTAVLILFLGTQIGYVGSTVNPFSVLIAQGVAGIPGNPQLWLRAIVWAVVTAMAIGFTMLYASRVKKNPMSSPVHENDLTTRTLFLKSDTDETPLSWRDRAILASLLFSLALIAWGLVTKGWYMAEIGSVFLGCGLAAGIFAGMGLNGVAANFVDGCKDFVYAAVVIGLARAILVIADHGMIIDTILDQLARLLGALPVYAFTTLMLLTHNVITFFVPSSSGEAALTMPVLAPLADLVGIQKDAMVTAYQFGNGLTNLISPTGGVLLAGLSIARIGFGQWLRVVLPLFGALWVVAAIFAAISAYV